MTKATIAGGVIAAALALLVLVVFVAAERRAGERDAAPAAATAPAADSPAPSSIAAAGEGHPGLLYGRVTGVDGVVYEGRLRFGGSEEALWGHYFNGYKAENPWAAHVAPERLPKERRAIEIFGIKLRERERQADLGRPLMARFGDIARIEARGRDLRVTLKSGTIFELDRFAADDFADGVRVWDAERGVVDLGERRVRAIELLPGAGRDEEPVPLYGTVRTRHGGGFTGLLQWNREESLGSDALDGRGDGGEVSLRFDAIRAIARQARDSALVTLLDGREIVLSGSPEVGRGNRGIYVDDRRYGRVLVSWDAFDRVDFDWAGTAGTDAAGTGPAYVDFPPGRPLTGTVTTRAGRRLAGRLVFDLDESETTETLDAPSHGVDYTIPFGLVASIVLPGRGARAEVVLDSGEALQLERAGDLGPRNGGMLIFVDGLERPEYVPWRDVAQIDLGRPLAIYLPSGAR